MAEWHRLKIENKMLLYVIVWPKLSFLPYLLFFVTRCPGLEVNIPQKIDKIIPTWFANSRECWMYRDFEIVWACFLVLVSTVFSSLSYTELTTDIAGPEIIDVNGFFQIPDDTLIYQTAKAVKNSSIQDVRDYMSEGINDLKIGEK